MALPWHSNAKRSFKMPGFNFFFFFSGGGISNAIPNVEKYLVVKRLLYVSAMLSAEAQELGQGSLSHLPSLSTRSFQQLTMTEIEARLNSVVFLHPAVPLI